MEYIEYLKDTALVDTGDVAVSFETLNPRDFNNYKSTKSSLDWTEQEYQLDGFRVRPYGANDDLPEEIKDIIQNNSIAPGILTKKAQLIWGKGPKLYRESLKDDKLVREWVEDPEVQKWLDSWDYLTYLTKINIDYSHIESCFTKFIQSKGHRINKPKFSKLEHVQPKKARLATPNTINTDEVTHCIVTDWNFKTVNSILKYKAYNLFDFKSPFKHKTSILYSNMYSFCSDYYTVPDIYGSLEWIRRSTAIPLILKALSKNSINLKYHVISPSIFWEKKKEELEAKCKEESREYKEKMLLDFRKKFLKKIAEVLSGIENTGKFWHSIKYVEVEGHKIFEQGWEIKEIKQNIASFVSSQIRIAEQANKAVAAGVGMHPALGVSGEVGTSGSGAEQLYALKNYLLTGIDIPEMIITKAINFAIQANFPDKGLKLGFYHIAPQREEEMNSKERLKEQI